LAEGAIPVVHPPREVPVPQREKVTEELQKDGKTSSEWTTGRTNRINQGQLAVDEGASRFQGTDTFILPEAISRFWQLNLDKKLHFPCTFRLQVVKTESQDYPLTEMRHRNLSRDNGSNG